MDSYFSLTNLLSAAICFLALLGTMFFNKKSRSHKKKKTMASSSLTLLPPPSSLPRNWIHHVFPSFHGEDVRKTFLSHIVKEFRSKGINLFIDNDIERSKLIGPELIDAIRGSRIAIVLISRNYASSTWCFNELVEIVKCKEEFGQTVMVLFYEVDPTHVKKQAGYFGKVFTNTCRGKTKEEIRRWKHALTEVAQIAGYHSANWKTEAKIIEDIATDVSNKLNLSAPCSDFDSLVGMESHMTEMGPLLRLDSDEVRKIGILGPPGIGKTTIARSLFNRHSQDFQLSVFMDNIKRKYAIPTCSDDYSVKLDLHKQFLSQLTNEMGIKIPHLGVAKDRLKDKKVLVVLDDVDHLVQLEAMAKETCWFGPGSRIIITTQDQKILKSSGINHIHKVNFPSRYEALQIFCMCAFGQKHPKDGFMELALDVTSLVGELPLGLKVMGSYFRGMSEQDWTEALPMLRTHLDRDGEIARILKFSYDALNDEDKRLFLHIACFFVEEPVDIVESCLANCFVDVTQGLRVLAEKSLISMESGWIEMAELLFQLGRQIVREQSVSEPGKRQFLHDKFDIGEVLSNDKDGSSSVIGIDLKEDDDITCTSERAFERLSNLQFLRINSKGINRQSMNYVSPKLRVLSWWTFQMPCFPSSFNPKFLVKLEMPYSKLEKLWEESKPLSNLKLMDLSFSEGLEELPDLSTATSLYDMDLTHCSSLVKLPSSIGNATKLNKLNLMNCSSLVEIPSSITSITSLKSLDLRGCSSLVELPFNVETLTDLMEIDLGYCSSLVKLPSSIGNTFQLQKLDLSDCSTLVELPLSIGSAMNLQELNLSYCSSLVELPLSIGNATNLQELNLNHCSNLMELPSSMKKLCRLMLLELEKCSNLEVILANINLESLREVNLSDCYLLKSYAESSTNIQELDPWIGRISRLRQLELSGMRKLVSLPPLPDSLLVLNAENCESLERLDCSFRNPDITLNFINCFKLNQEARDLIIHTPTSAVFPADEVPMCFSYRSSGSSLTVKLNQMPIGKSTKFKACILCAGEDEKDFIYGGSVCCSITSGGNALTACYNKIKRVFPGHLCTFEVEVETEEVISTELVFDFELGFSQYEPMVDDSVYKQMVRYVKQKISNKWEIRECGILQLLQVPLRNIIESFEDGSEDYEPSDNEIGDKP